MTQAAGAAVIARWPASMRRKTAAEYLDMSEPAFEREIIAGRMPTGVMLGGREHWLKASIDAALDNLSGSPDEPAYLKNWREKYDS